MTQLNNWFFSLMEYITPIENSVATKTHLRNLKENLDEEFIQSGNIDEKKKKKLKGSQIKLREQLCNE